MISHGYIWLLSLMTLPCDGVPAQAPFLSPFFFLCNYHGNVQELGVEQGEVALSVSVSGNPDYYIPGQFYQITVASSMNFNGFLLTGLYTLSDFAGANLARFGSPAIQANQPVGQNLMCSIVHSHMSRQPQHQLSIMWLSPPKGTGCISFLATATLGDQVLFKDTTVLQMCEEGAQTLTPARPLLTTIHSDGIILRDDFESGNLFNKSLWMYNDGSEVGSQCGTVLHGAGAVFCDRSGIRTLTTLPLNLTTTSVLQFAVTAGMCRRNPGLDKDIHVQYGLSGCTDWRDIESVSPPYHNLAEIHLVHLPDEAQSPGVCLRWFQPRSGGAYKGCWVLDNVLVVNTARPPPQMDEQFDPIRPANWLFFPGAEIKHKCLSEKNALVFNKPDQIYNFVSTRDLDLQADEADLRSEAILTEEFESKFQPGWFHSGGRVDTTCGVVKVDNSLVFDSTGNRQACTPLMDTKSAGNLRFYFTMGGGCNWSESHKAKVLVYLEDEKNGTYILQTLEPKGFQKPKLVSIPLNGPEKPAQARVCWIQKAHGGANKDGWALDDVMILTHLPKSSSTDKVIQFSLNLECGGNATENVVDVEFSPDHGLHWHKLHTPCYPGTCRRDPQLLTSRFESSKQSKWQRHTLPLPFSALTPHARFRWRQSSHITDANWALDNVFIGDCPDKCTGHGICVGGNTCQCDFGYSGPTCSRAVRPNSLSLVERFTETTKVPTLLSYQLDGASLRFICDVVATGKAVVFYKDGIRQLLTQELNTTDTRYLQFSVRIGSNSATSLCRPPDDPSEGVLVEYSCDGGISWQLLKHLIFDEYRKPMMDSVMLPPEAQQDGCKFRWRQPIHSGLNQDVWAIDDISLTKDLLNMLNIEVSDMADDLPQLTVNEGKLQENFCGTPKSLGFVDEQSTGNSRFVSTEPMRVGPSYLLQFELVMGCDQPYSTDMDNRLYLEFSTDHGLSWKPVVEPCLPPKKCDEYKPGTVFDASQFRRWSHATVMLPPETWSPATRFRLRQPEWGPEDTWGITRLYVGQQCPKMCHGHGKCVEGACQCDKGYVGTSCAPEVPLDTSMQADFGFDYYPDTDFRQITGGDVASSHQGCGMVLSGENLYFSKTGVRQVSTKDMNTTGADYIQFYIRLGGTSGPGCNGVQTRNESVLLQYSSDGGITWNLLEDMFGPEFSKPKFVHVQLPKNAKTEMTQFRWWQPAHSGPGHDQWALDDIHVGNYKHLNHLEDSFDQMSLDVRHSDLWLTITDGVLAKYCRQRDLALVLANQENDKSVVTKDLMLERGYVIQFKINVGCEKRFRWDHPVLLQYSSDFGRSWKLVQDPCYQGDTCESKPKPSEGSVYYSGTHGDWTLVVIPVAEELALRPVMLRWFQPGGMMSSFALDDVYIGPPCLNYCNHHGVCQQGNCSCEYGFLEPDCSPPKQHPKGMVDRFDNTNMPSDSWKSIRGGHLGKDCGFIDYGNSLYFSGKGTREAKTVPLDTSALRMLQFVITIGSTDDKPECVRPSSRREGIVLDYSLDNGVTWRVLKVVEPLYYNSTVQAVSIDLPRAAKTSNTMFRWWQPLGFGEIPRAQWALDSVMIGVNDSSASGFQDDFSEMMPNPAHWFMVADGIPKIGCNSNGNAFEFSRSDAGTRFAETWDYHVTPSTFLQFDLAMGCGGAYSQVYSVMLQYSVNMGKTWHPLIEECMPPHFECAGYHLSSEYHSDHYMNWTRVTVYLPPGAISPATRFRWQQHPGGPRGNIWALDNVYLGQDCPWLCSGHGYCNKGTCLCDEGFSGPHCVPYVQQPMMMRDDFNKPVDRSWWPEIYGGEVSRVCGTVVSDTALSFYKESRRMAVTRDLDTSMTENVEFFLLFGCKEKESDWPRSHSVLLQYSNNGGIKWHLLQELHYRNETEPRFYSLTLPTAAKVNATRFRFWQPKHGGHLVSGWAIDNWYVGTMIMKPNIIYETFDGAEPNEEFWLFANNGKMGRYCGLNTRRDTTMAGQTAIVFRHGQGEKSLVSRDMEVGPRSVLMFDINVGCESNADKASPVRVEHSSDGGKSWHLLSENCLEYSISLCQDKVQPPSVYYSGSSHYWRRVIIPLTSLHTCGSVRFRWHQEAVPEYSYAPEWAVDNVYMGMMCAEHCRGQGSCINGMLCQCDHLYAGDTCVSSGSNPKYLKDSFDGQSLGKASKGRSDVNVVPHRQIKAGVMDESKWLSWTGGEISTSCGVLLTGSSLYFRNTGDRILTTVDLDLTRGSLIQFYVKLGCKDKVDSNASPILLQYSTNGGIHWATIEQFDFHATSNQPDYIVVHIPLSALTNSTRIRWWQPSLDGSFLEDWALDQVYIGGEQKNQALMQDEPYTPRDSNWLLSPGGEVEEVCGSTREAIHFAGEDIMRYAISADIQVEEGSFIQFDLAMGCAPSQQCYGVELQFSLDMGKTWSLLRDACLPSNLDCSHYYSSSIFYSDLFSGWKRVLLPLPYYTKSAGTRFRWLQPSGFRREDSWAISGLFVGNGCPQLCSGHGWCNEGICRCEDSWQGAACDSAKSPLPRLLMDTFTSAVKKGNWLTVLGGEVKSTCSVVGAGTALHFTQGCSRMLVSRDLDLREAVYVQFNFLFGCLTPPRSREGGVLLDFSTNGGISWQHLEELYFNLYTRPTFVSIKLPTSAKTTGVRIRWWQPLHPGNRLADWAIDNIVIGGEMTNPDTLVDKFESGLSPENWQQTNRIRPGEFCDEVSAAIGEATDTEAAILTTRDLDIKAGNVLQFSINIGCGAPEELVPPVAVQYSLDYGMTWKNLVPQCLENDPHCLGVATMASLYYAVNGWRRIVIKFTGQEVSMSTRFRWIQSSSVMEPSSTWALADVYIGSPCINFCRGHGQCDYPYCICDEGYGGEDCILVNTSAVLPQLKDSFGQPDVNASKWSLVQGASIDSPCETMVEGSALFFTGPALRQVVTNDLDLRDAVFLQYYAMIGGTSKDPFCFEPTSLDQSVVLQFSVDGEITWNTLHVLDYTSYTHPTRDYITLPLAARTNCTRLRWWQPLPSSDQSAPSWALDNVLIGGSEVNPSEFEERFDDEPVQDDAPWEFCPFGEVQQNVCEKLGSSMSYGKGKGIRIFTTNQLIVQEGYIIQFKIAVGCEEIFPPCENHHAPIRLEFNRNPASDTWELLETACLPGNDVNNGCKPYIHHGSSIYTMDQGSGWRRITIEIPYRAYSSVTRFRWIQTSPDKVVPGWALDDVYIGERCDTLCNGRGDCVAGRCECDPGYLEHKFVNERKCVLIEKAFYRAVLNEGVGKSVDNTVLPITRLTSSEDPPWIACERFYMIRPMEDPSVFITILRACYLEAHPVNGSSCKPIQYKLPKRLYETFEGGLSEAKWETIAGGEIGFGCGALLPNAHGKNLYFKGCGEREAVTKEMDLTDSSQILFVIQIGSVQQRATCNVNFQQNNPSDGSVLLQYSTNKGVDWRLLANHNPADFLQARQVMYEFPADAQRSGVQFRWWQPQHGGLGHDQWAIDNVEIVGRLRIPTYRRRRHAHP